ncbi:hypothetical protein [Pseudomonas orientalis]|uniref:hypothetical protein n=1 Tax=Pseudomonas orientalis TaxID=76758 RepID=UPI000F059ACC
MLVPQVTGEYADISKPSSDTLITFEPLSTPFFGLVQQLRIPPTTFFVSVKNEETHQPRIGLNPMRQLLMLLGKAKEKAELKTLFPLTPTGRALSFRAIPKDEKSGAQAKQAMGFEGIKRVARQERFSKKLKQCLVEI